MKRRIKNPGGKRGGEREEALYILCTRYRVDGMWRMYIVLIALLKNNVDRSLSLSLRVEEAEEKG